MDFSLKRLSINASRPSIRPLRKWGLLGVNGENPLKSTCSRSPRVAALFPDHPELRPSLGRVSRDWRRIEAAPVSSRQVAPKRLTVLLGKIRPVLLQFVHRAAPVSEIVDEKTIDRLL